MLPLPDIKDCIGRHCPVPYMRYGHTAVSWNNNAYIWGGRNDKNGACNGLFCFNTELLEWLRVRTSGDKPSGRDGHSACVISSRMYIFGGFEERIDRYTDEVYALNFSTFTWMYVKCSGRIPIWRDFHSASAIGNKMYIYGGRSDNGGNQFTGSETYDQCMHVLDVTTNTWSTEQPVHGIKPNARRSHSAWVYKGCLYIWGGYNGLLSTHFGDMFRYDPESRDWSMVLTNGLGPCARRRQSACLVGNKVYLFGGTSPIDPDTQQRICRGVTLLDHSDLHILDYNPSLKTLCLCAVRDHAQDVSSLPQDLRWEFEAMTKPNTISRSSVNSG